MLDIIWQSKKTIKRIIALLPNRLLQLVFTTWLERVNQQEVLHDSDCESLNVGLNTLLGKLAQQEPKSAMRSLLEIDEILTNYINQVAVKYDNGLHVKHRLTKYHDFFTERIQNYDRVLDIGCGTGSLAYDIAVKSNAIVTGIDINSESIQFAKEHFLHSNLTFIEGDILSFKINQNFDVIVLSNILEHIENRIRFLKKISTDFNPKKILIRVPLIDRHWLVPLRKELGLFYFSDITHCTEYTQNTFEYELKLANLNINHLQISWGEIWAEVIQNS